MEKERIPTEAETIAVKRAVRLAEKLRRARESITMGSAWWGGAVFEVVALVLISFLNIYLVLPFFGTSSVDTFFSGPIVPLLAKFIELFGPPLSYSIQIVNIFFFLIFPISLYFFVRFITGRKLAALLAVLFSSLPFYPFGHVRVYASLLGNDTAHIASLSIVPIALLGLISFIHNGGGTNLVIASISSAMVALISPFGFMVYGIFAGISAFSEVLLGRGRLKLFRLFSVFLIAGGLCSFWYNPAFFFWMIIGPMGVDVRHMISRLIPVSFFSLPALGAFGYLLFDRKPNLQPLFLASFFTIAFAMIGLAGGGIFPSHPGRYMSEFGISLSFLLSVVIVYLADYLKFTQNPKLVKYKKGYLVNTGLAALVFLLTSLTVIGKYKLVQERQVLGIWEGVGKGDIWEAKEAFGGALTVLGYTISGITLFGLGALVSKNKKAPAPRGY